MTQMSIIPDSKTPLGANYDPLNKCVNFSLYSKNATMVILCIFEKPKGEDPVMNLIMKKRPGADIFETCVKTYVLGDLKKPLFYGYRVFGPNWEFRENFEPGTNIGFKSKVDDTGNRFNPNKLAYDPYSKELSHLPSDVCPDLSIFRSGNDCYLEDNAKLAPKSVLFKDENPDPITMIEPRPFSEEVIGEVHIKDLTRNLPNDERGTYAAAAKFAPRLKEMGFTMVEFLPLLEFDHREDGQNYWGYMTLAYFCAARHYAHNKEFGETLKEFRKMVDEFHKNGIKVCLDVVFNHTGEARIHYHNNNDASLMSYALIDNSSYYKLTSNKCEGECTTERGYRKYYRSNSGCHNDTNTTNEGFYNLVADAVAFWAKQGVDAFRFDLAVSLMDASEGEIAKYNPYTSLAANLTKELEKRGVEVITDPTRAQEGIMLIAEPWTCGGSNGYQLGNFPDNWMEWNDVSRDTIRRAGMFYDHITMADVRNILEGTKTRFPHKYGAINYICSHDGFTLYDANSYKKRDLNTMGGSDWEVSTDNNNDLKTKENAIKKQLALLFLSKGTPMLQVGDIIMHSKCGNNNSYNRDDETNYYDYTLSETEGTFENRIYNFAKCLLKLRKENKIFSKNDYDKKLKYFNEFAQALDNTSKNFFEDYQKGYMGVLVDDMDEGFFIAYSKSPDKVSIKLPPAREGKNWYIIFDTYNDEHTDCEPKAFFGLDYVLNPSSLVLFKEV